MLKHTYKYRLDSRVVGVVSNVTNLLFMGAVCAKTEGKDLHTK